MHDYDEIKLTKTEKIDYLRDELSDLRNTVYNHRNDQQNKQKAQNQLIFMSVYCFLIGYLIGKKPQEKDAD